MLKNKTKLFLLFSLVLITLVGVSAVSAVAVDNSTTTLEAAPSYTADTQANINTADDNNKNLEQSDVSTITSTQKDTAQEAKAVSTKTVEKTNTKQLKTVDPQNGIDVSFPSTVIAGNDLTVTVTYDQTVEEGDITAFIMKNEEYQSDFTDGPITFNDNQFSGTTGTVTLEITNNIADGTYYLYVTLMDDEFDEHRSAIYPLEITGGIVPVINTSVDIDFESPVTAGSDVLVNVTTGEALNGALLNIELFYPDNDPEEFGSLPDQSYWSDHNQEYLTLTSTFNQYTFTLPEDINGTCHLIATVDALTTELSSEFSSEIKPLEVIANVEKTTPSLTMDVDEDPYQEDGIVVYGELRDEDYEGISNASITVTVTYTQDGNDTSLKGDEVQTVDTITDEEGQYQVTIPALHTGTINVVADFAGNDNYNTATSDTKSTRVIKNEDKPKETVKIIFVEDPFYYDDDVISVNGYLEDVNGDQIDASDITVTVTVTYSDNTQLTNSSVTENGEFDVTIPANAVLGDATIVITTTANDVYDAATETYQTEIIARPDVNITLESSNVTYPDDIVINGQVTSNVDDVITNVAGSNINISVTNKNGESRNYTTTTDSEGKYTYSIPVNEDDIGEVTISVALDDMEYKTKTNTTTVEVTEVIKTTPTIEWELDPDYPVDAVVSINGYIIGEDEGIEDLPVTVTLTYAGEEPIVKEITTTTDGEFEYVFTAEDGKKAGDLTVTVTTGETQEYESTSQTEETVITPAEAKETSLSLDPMDDYYDDTIEVEGTISYIDVDGNEQDLPAGMNVNVVVTFADSTTIEETATVADEGIFTVSIPTEDKYGVAQVVATFVETPEYLGSSDNKDVTVRYPTDLTIFADESTQEEGLTVTGYLTYGDSEDFAGQTITVTATYTNGDLVDTFDVTTEEDGTFTITRDALATGEVTIVAEYDGTNVYRDSEDSITTTINENEPKETIITPGLDNTATDIIDIQATIDYIDINGDQIPLPTGEATITVTFADGTTTTTPTTINNGEITTTIPTQGKTGQATINISYPGTEDYKATEAIVTVNILEVPDLFVDAEESTLSEGLTVNGYLDDAEGNGIAGQTITITATYDDDFTDTFTATTEDDGTYTTTVPAHKIGEVSIVATFDETTQYAAAEDEATTTITEDEPKETIITPGLDDTATDIIDIQATIDYIDINGDQIPLPTGEATITVTFADGTTTTTPTTINNGEITTTIPTQGKTGQATINISYPGTEEYKPTEAIVTVNILTQTYLSVEADDAAMDEELEIYGSLVTKDDDEGIADATINIKVTYADGQTQDLTVTTDENGDYQTTTTPLAIGNVTIVATFDETTAYAESEDNTTTIITPKELIQPEFVFSGETIESGEPMVIDAEIGYWNDDDEFVGIPNLTINVEVTFEDGTIISNQTTSTEDGKITYTVDTTGKTGNATVTLTSVATDEYESATTTDIYEITEVTTIPTTITLDANDVYYSERNATINGTLTYKDGNEQKAFAGQNITVTITYENDDGIPEEYLVTTDENGKFTVPIKPNGLGPATITAVYAGNVTEDKEYDADETSNDVEIALVEYAITFDEDQTEWDFNSTATITGKVTSNLPELDVNDMNVTVENEEPFKVTLNEDGTFSFEVPEVYAGDYDVTAQVNDAIETITLHFDQAESGITAEADKDHTFVNDQVTISGTLTNIDSNVPINGANITITINGTPINAVIVTDDDGKFSYTYKPVSTGNLSIVVSFEGDSNYPGCSIDEPIMVEVTEGIETELTVDPITDAKVGEPTTISGKLTDTEGNPIAGETVTITINGKDQNVTTDDEGKYSLEYTPETNETNVTVSYPGNNEYLPANNVTTTINADKRSLQIIIINTNNDVKVNDNVTIAVLLVDGDKIVKVETLKFNQTPQAANNITTFTVSNNVNGTVTINVSFDGDERYDATSNTTNITFNNLNTQIVANDNSVQNASINDTVTLSVDVIDENGNAVTEGTVVFTSEGKTLGTATISNGKATITTTFDKAGSHDVTVTYTAEKNYNEATNNYTVKAIIDKLDVKVNVTTPTSSKVGQPQNITVTAPGYANKPVQVTIGNETKTVNTDATGKAVIPYTPTEAGKVPVTVTIPESNDYSQQTVTSNFTVAKGTVTITVSPDTQSVAYPNNATYTITLKDSNGKTIAGEYIKVDGVIVNMTNAQGQVVAKVSKDAGNYSIKVEYPGSENYNSQSRNVVLNVTKAKVTVSVTNITGKVDEKLEVTAKLNQNITGGVVTFTDKDGNKLATATVVNGNAYAYVSFDKTYNGKINAAFSNNPNYENATGSGNAKINALSTVVTVDPLHNVTPGTATSITGKVTDENGKPVAGVPVNVTVGGSTKTATTDKDGNFNVPYTPTTAGDNTVKVSVPATNSTTAQNVTQTVSINKKTSKLTVNNIAAVNIGQNITVTGTLNDGTGKAMANTKLVVNIDGKSTTVTTNSTGGFKHTAKTTQAGKSIVTVSYAGDSNYEACAAVVKTATVNKNKTTTTVTSISGKALANKTVKATVKYGNTNVPNGMVVFTDNKGKTLGVANVSKGTAQIIVSYDEPFTGTVTANYLESANYTASKGNNTIAISKLNTKVTLDPIKGKVNDVINVTAKVVDENGKAVNNGTVTFKLNGITQSLNGKAITAYVNNGVAVAQLPTNSTWMASGNNTKYLTAKYSGDAVYDESESARVNTNLTKRTAQVSITSDRIVAHGGDNISITAVVTDEGKLVNGGTVIFKIAGETIRDAKGNTIKVNVVNGQATLNHSIAIGASAKPDMPIVAVYSNGNLYNRAENSSKLTVLKADVYFNTTIAYGKNGKAVINVTLRDAFGNLCVLDTYVAIKVDGSTYTHVDADDGKIYTTIDVSKLKKGVHTVEYVAGANNRYNDARYTNALVIE